MPLSFYLAVFGFCCLFAARAMTRRRYRRRARAASPDPRRVEQPPYSSNVFGACPASWQDLGPPPVYVAADFYRPHPFTIDLSEQMMEERRALNLWSDVAVA